MSAINLKNLLPVVVLLLTSCSGIRVDSDFIRDPAVEQRIISQQADAFPEIHLLELNDDIRAYLEQHVSLGASRAEKVARLQELLFGEQYLNIAYRDSANYSAIETFNTREANCLSLVNLYIAMARHLDLDANYHSVKIKPRWDLRGELMVLSEHINATGRVSRDVRYVIDFLPEINLQQRTAAIIDDSVARALYFNNLAVEQLMVQEYEAALRYLHNALWLAPDLAIAWNNIGAVYNRLRQTELAEYSYQRSFEIDDSSATAINNLAKFYYAQKDFEKADIYNRAIHSFNRRNPYYHYLLGNIAYSDQRFEQARRHYQAAIHRHDSEPDFYLAMGQAHLQLGEEKEGIRMLEMGLRIMREADQLTMPSREKLRMVRGNEVLRISSSEAERSGLVTVGPEAAFR